MAEEALKNMFRDLYETYMESLLTAISTLRRVAVLHILIDKFGGRPARHKDIAREFRRVLSASEVSRILAKLVKSGLVEKRPDGSFKVTRLGRVVGKWLKLFVLWRIKDDPVGREHLRAAFDLALSVFRMKGEEGPEDYLGELRSGVEFLNELRSELERELEVERPPSPLRITLG